MPPQRINLFSYGCNEGSIDPYPDDGLVFDIRKLHSKEVKVRDMENQTGLNRKLRQKLLQNFEFVDKLEEIMHAVSESNNEQINVTVMCHQGKHRSVSVVEALREHFENDAKVTVRHLSLEEE